MTTTTEMPVKPIDNLRAKIAEVDAALADIPPDNVGRTPALWDERTRLVAMVEELERGERTRAAAAEARKRAAALAPKIEAFRKRAQKALQPIDSVAKAVEAGITAVAALRGDYDALVDESRPTGVNVPSLAQLIGVEEHQLQRLHAAAAILGQGH